MATILSQERKKAEDEAAQQLREQELAIELQGITGSAIPQMSAGEFVAA